MTRYFIAANIWLFVALALFVGRTLERTEPDCYSVFHGGLWVYPATYTLLNLVVVAVAAIFFALTWTTRNKP